MTYVISDLHGYDPVKLARLFAAAGVGDGDRVYVLGDVIDRGEYGVELLSWASGIGTGDIFTDFLERRGIVKLGANGELTVLDPEAFDLIKRLLGTRCTGFILGNHEHMMLESEAMFEEITDDSVSRLCDRDAIAWSRWQMNGADTTVTGLRRLIAKGDINTVYRMLDFIENAPLYLEIRACERDFVLVHAGLGNYYPERRLEDYTVHDLVWVRPKITTAYEGERTVVFGHTPTCSLSGDMRNLGKVLRGRGWLCIDAGAAAGAGPALVCLDTMKAYNGEAHDGV